MISIICNPDFSEEKKYIINVLLNEIMDIDYELCFKAEVSGYNISLNDGKLIHLRDEFFSKAKLIGGYDNSNILPKSVEWVRFFDADDNNLPVLFGTSDFYLNDSQAEIGSDVFGTAFFLITNLDEFFSDKRDKHNRFPHQCSFAYQYGFLERPIVDEYVFFLNKVMYELGFVNSLKREPRKNITCDVDWPFDPKLSSLKMTLKHALASVLVNKDIVESINSIGKYISSKLGFVINDNYLESLRWIMEQNEKVSNQVTFFFIPNKTAMLDSDDDLESGRIDAILQEIHARGHIIGVHPGYNTTKNDACLTRSLDIFYRKLSNLNIKQDYVASRLHYLMWDIKSTPQNLDSKGVDIDSTLGFAGYAGFRCGTSHEFTMFDLVGKRAMKIKQRPLIAMESSIISERYENLGYSEKSLARFNDLKVKTLNNSGIFTLLWHNCHLINTKDRNFYRELIK